jgi:hypothetical protein
VCCITVFFPESAGTIGVVKISSFRLAEAHGDVKKCVQSLDGGHE